MATANIKVTGFEKNGAIMVFITDDPKGRNYRIDFQQGHVYGLNNRPINSVDTIRDKFAFNTSRFPELQALSVLWYDCNAKTPKFFQAVESFMSYPDLLKTPLDSDMVFDLENNYDGKLPKGYVAWLRKNQSVFNRRSLHQFIRETFFKTMPQSLAEELNRFIEGSQIDLIDITHSDPELCVSILRMTHNSLKRYEIYNLRSKIIAIANMLRLYPDLRSYLDDTKSVNVVFDILQGQQDNARNRKIIAEQSKIAALNGMQFGDLVVKVPLTMNAFTEEGKQQHNCVGYYYHDSIAQGKYFIYFLRRANKLSKSYITCRVDRGNNKTVEHRFAYNVRAEDNVAPFKDIDKAIQEIMNKQEVK